MWCEKIQGNVTTLAFSPPHQFLKDGIPYMNEVQEKILRQHLLAGTWKVCRWALVSSALCSWLSFTQITFCRNAETYWSELPTVPACCGVWRKTEITGYYVENWVQVVKWSFCIPTVRHKASPVKSIPHTASFHSSSSSNADRDVLKKAIDEVTSWIAAAKEEDTMILQDLNGMKQCLS